jgi:phage host-nuclease inhibitor protein Gam
MLKSFALLYLGDHPMVNEKSEKINLVTLDKQLRATELNLQQGEPKLEKEKMLEPSSIDTVVAANIGNLDKIREILFGGQIRDYEKRFRRLEERLSQEGVQLRDELLQRVKSLEDLLMSETEGLTEKMKLERQERYEANQDFIREINSLKTEINNRFVQLDEQVSKDIKQLRQQFQNQLQELIVQFRQQKDNLTLLIRQEVAQLKEEKLARSDLAAFFTEFALRLNKDFNTNSIEND